MPPVVTSNAMLVCSFGTSPSSLTVLPSNMVNANNQPVATIMDKNPMANIKPFGMCNTPSNPQVATATAAAQGVLTPQPCIPVIVAPWSPGSAKVLVKNMPVVTTGHTCNCNWGGVIQITNPGQTTVQA